MDESLQRRSLSYTTTERIKGAAQIGAIAFFASLGFNAPVWFAAIMASSGVITGAINGPLGSRAKR